MPEFSLSAVAAAFTFAALLSSQFHQDMALPKQFAAFNLGGLALLVAILPWIQKGSFLAFVVGYMLVAVLLVNMLFLFAVAHLPGQHRVSLSTASAKAGSILLKMVGAGLVVCFQMLLKLVVWGWTQIQTGILWLALPKLQTI
jgi:hypothetical protein